MPDNVSNADPTHLTPDNAFSALGNETRMEILQALADANSPVSFSDLRERIGMRDSGQFNYHLGKLEGHFVQKTTDGYLLRQPGRRIIEAILSGAVIENPVIHLTDVDIPCFRCGGAIKLSFQGERVETFCTDCEGVYGEAFNGSPESPHTTDKCDTDDYGYLGGFALPSAGIRNRTPREVFETAFTWSHIELLAAAYDTCPRCAAPIEESVSVCENHTASDSPCDKCNSYYQVIREWTCTNCNRWSGGPLQFKCWADTDVLAFLTSHGVNPFRLQPALADVTYDETLHSTNPFKAEYTISIDGDSINVFFDDDLSISKTVPS